MKTRYPYKSESELIEQAKTLAANYAREGWGSRATVLHAIYDLFEIDIPPDMFVRFCSILDPLHAPSSGIHFADGRRAGVTVCGALTSALVAFGMLFSERDLPYGLWEIARPGGWLGEILDDPNVPVAEKVRVFNDESDKGAYGAHQHIALRFYEHFGTTDCYDLQKPFGNPVSRDCFRNCGRVLIWTAGMVTEVILAYAKDPSAFKLTADSVNCAVIRDLSV